MKTEKIMLRSILDQQVRQSSKSGFFCANDLVELANTHRRENGKSSFVLKAWLTTESTKEFIQELEVEFGDSVVLSKRGRNGGTWIHPILFFDLALTISPKLKVKVYKWINDELLKYRNDSGDSFQKMTGAIYTKCTDKSRFSKYIIQVSMKIKKACGVDDWQSASEDKLKLRDKMHENIALLCSVTSKPDKAVVVGINKALADLES